MTTSAPSVTASRWLRCRGPRPQARLRLVCLPHAGGAASFFRRWHDTVPDSVELHVVQYPGREDRIGERCVGEMTELADRIAAAVRPLGTLPLALFGHSMGAAVAFEVTRRLEASRTELRRLFVSGRPAPHRQRPRNVHQGGDAALAGELTRLGGTRPSVLDEPELRQLVLPALRNDYRLIETYQPAPGGPLRTPVVVYRGEADPELRPDEALDWAATTTGGTEQRVFPGGHFYLASAHEQVIADLLERLGIPQQPAAGWPSTP